MAASAGTTATGAPATTSTPLRLRASLMSLARHGFVVLNLVQGLIDRQLLGIHHVRDDLGAPPGRDLAFLAFGVMLIAGGPALARGARIAAARGSLPR